MPYMHDFQVQFAMLKLSLNTAVLQEVATPVEDGASEQTTLLTGPIQGDVVTINQRALDLMLLQVVLLDNAASCISISSFDSPGSAHW